MTPGVVPDTPVAVKGTPVTETVPTGEGGGRSSTGRGYDIVLLAASAGGLAAISAVLGALPDGFPVPVVLVQHLDPRHTSHMAEILRRRTALQVEDAVEGAVAEAATVYIAPPDEHLLVNPGGRLSLSHSDPVHFVRPSGDRLFESGAEAFPGRAIGVVLTGTGSDANMGVRAIQESGGTVIAQDPATAEFAGMPEAAIATGGVDLVLPLEKIGPALVELVERGGAS
jgi:two-component system, chemotaxis family, protein-glutamate methylesterase/glutaminase